MHRLSGAFARDAGRVRHHPSRQWIPGSVRCLRVEVTALPSENFRTAAVDAPGHGEAADIPGCTMATQFAATINELDAADHVLLGHSMTGKVAQLLASLEGKALGPEIPPAELILLTPIPLSQEVRGPQLRESFKASIRDRADAQQFRVKTSEEESNRAPLYLPVGEHLAGIGPE